ncbi:MAG: hypothetical protein RXR03_07680 [Thermocladium sp.]
MSTKQRGGSEEEEKTMDMVRKLAINLCSNDELENRVKCTDNALSWSDEEITKYIANTLPDPEKSIYLSNTHSFNEVFKITLGISGIFATLINTFVVALDYHIKQMDRVLNSAKKDEEGEEDEEETLEE